MSCSSRSPVVTSFNALCAHPVDPTNPHTPWEFHTLHTSLDLLFLLPTPQHVFHTRQLSKGAYSLVFVHVVHACPYLRGLHICTFINPASLAKAAAGVCLVVQSGISSRTTAKTGLGLLKLDAGSSARLDPFPLGPLTEVIEGRTDAPDGIQQSPSLRPSSEAITIDR